MSAVLGVNWSAPLSSLAGDVAIGYALVDDDAGRFLVSTSGNRGTKRSSGLAITAGNAATPVVMVTAGDLPTTITGLTAGSASALRVSSSGALERVATPGASDDVVGWVETNGLAHVVFGVLTHRVFVDSGGGGGGSPGGASGDLQYNNAGSFGGITPAAGVTTWITTPSGANLAATLTSALPASKGGTGLTALAAGVATFLGTATSANLASAVSDETGSGALVFANTPSLVTPKISDSAGGQFYNIAVSDLAADRTVTLPLLGADDTFVFAAFAQTLTNKTISFGSNTVSFTSAQAATACSDETGSGALVFGTSPTIATPTLTGTVTHSGSTLSNTSGSLGSFSIDAYEYTSTGSSGEAAVTVALADNSTTLVFVFASYERTAGTAGGSFVHTNRFRRSGATINAGTAGAIYASQEGTCAVDIDNPAASTNWRIYVVGEAATNINWKFYVVRVVAHT